MVLTRKTVISKHLRVHQSSFIEGIARLVDHTGSLNISHETDDRQVDLKASLYDWQHINTEVCSSDSLVRQAEQDLLADPVLLEIIKLTSDK